MRLWPGSFGLRKAQGGRGTQRMGFSNPFFSLYRGWVAVTYASVARLVWVTQGAVDGFRQHDLYRVGGCVDPSVYGLAGRGYATRYR